MTPKREIPPGSREEAQLTESVLYGIIHSTFLITRKEIERRFVYYGSELRTTDDPIVPFDGLIVHMGSGDYEVTIKQIKANVPRPDPNHPRYSEMTRPSRRSPPETGD